MREARRAVKAWEGIACNSSAIAREKPGPGVRCQKNQPRWEVGDERCQPKNRTSLVESWRASSRAELASPILPRGLEYGIASLAALASPFKTASAKLDGGGACEESAYLHYKDIL